MSILTHVFLLALLLAPTVGRASMRMNEIQATGTHNSYHIQSITSKIIKAWGYTQQPLTVQLNSGVRQLELDVHLKSNGQFYVHHVAGVDQGTRCKMFEDCLREIREWSKANPNHIPLLVWIEIKDKDFDRYLKRWKMETTHIREIEAAVSHVFFADDLITPDSLRGTFASVPDAIHKKGWPELSSVRGKVIFALMGSNDDYNAYYGKPAQLSSRLFFANAHEDVTAVYAGFFKADDPIHHLDEIKALLHGGFIVTVTGDLGGNSDADNFARARASLASGAQYISTNFTYPQANRTYWFNLLPRPACNPVLLPNGCQQDLETGLK